MTALGLMAAVVLGSVVGWLWARRKHRRLLREAAGLQEHFCLENKSHGQSDAAETNQYAADLLRILSGDNPGRGKA